MFTYLFKCDRAHDPECDTRVSLMTRDPSAMNAGEPHTFVRDYRSERVGIGSGVAVSRDGLIRDQAEIFLPTNKDFKGAGDPDGTKGMRKWRDEHAAKSSKAFWPGDVERKVY